MGMLKSKIFHISVKLFKVIKGLFTYKASCCGCDFSFP